MKQFAKPSRKSREEPPGLDAFAEGAPGAVHAVVPVSTISAQFHAESARIEKACSTNSPADASKPSAAPAPSPPRERETLGMNVRFTRAEKATLEALAARQGRSQHQVLKRLLGPVLRRAADELDFGGEPK